MRPGDPALPAGRNTAPGTCFGIPTQMWGAVSVSAGELAGSTWRCRVAGTAGPVAASLLQNRCPTPCQALTVRDKFRISCNSLAPVGILLIDDRCRGRLRTWRPEPPGVSKPAAPRVRRPRAPGPRPDRREDGVLTKGSVGCVQTCGSQQRSSLPVLSAARRSCPSSRPQVRPLPGTLGRPAPAWAPGGVPVTPIPQGVVKYGSS
jgi:hypothetical protein